MTYILPDELTTALWLAFTAPTKARRAAEARKAAELLRAGRPISEDARRYLAAALDGKLRPGRGRPVTPAVAARRALAVLDYFDRRRADPSLSKDEALERVAPDHRTKPGTLAEWVYPHKKRKK